RLFQRPSCHPSSLLTSRALSSREVLRLQCARSLSEPSAAREAAQLGLEAARRMPPQTTENPEPSACLCRASVQRSSWSHPRVDCHLLDPQAVSELPADSEQETARQTLVHLHSQGVEQQARPVLSACCHLLPRRT